MIPYSSEKSVKKLTEGIVYYKDALFEEDVYKCFADIIQKAKKVKADNKNDHKSALEEFEKIVKDLHDKAAEHEKTAEMASEAYEKKGKRGDVTVEEVSVGVDELSLTQVKSKKRAPRPQKKRVQKIVEEVENDEDDDNLSDAENHIPVSQKVKNETSEEDIPSPKKRAVLKSKRASRSTRKAKVIIDDSDDI